MKRWRFNWIAMPPGALSREVRCLIRSVDYKVDISTLEQNRVTGSLILIDEGSNQTVAAGMII